MPSRREVPLTAPKRLLRDYATAADALGVNERFVRKLVATGQIPGYRIGKKFLRVDLSDVEAFAVRVRPEEVSP